MTRRACRAQVLLVVVWVMGVLTVAVGALVARATHELRLGFFPAQRVQMRATLQAAVAEVAAQLSQDDPEVDALNACGLATLDSWELQPPQDRPIGESAYSVGQADELGWCAGLTDEAGKLSLNHADATALERLIAAKAPEGEPATLAAAILDWRDETPGTFCAAAIPPCRNGPLASVDELRLVPGVTPAIFDALQSYVTVFSDGQVNANTAPAVVLDALGYSGAALAEQRAEQPFTPDNPPPLGLVTASTVFTLAVEAQAAGSHAQAEAVVDRTGQILAWHQHQ